MTSPAGFVARGACCFSLISSPKRALPMLYCSGSSSPAPCALDRGSVAPRRVRGCARRPPRACADRKGSCRPLRPAQAQVRRNRLVWSSAPNLGACAGPAGLARPDSAEHRIRSFQERWRGAIPSAAQGPRRPLSTATSILRGLRCHAGARGGPAALQRPACSQTQTGGWAPPGEPRAPERGARGTPAACGSQSKSNVGSRLAHVDRSWLRGPAGILLWARTCNIGGLAVGRRREQNSEAILARARYSQWDAPNFSRFVVWPFCSFCSRRGGGNTL